MQIFIQNITKRLIDTKTAQWTNLYFIMVHLTNIIITFLWLRAIIIFDKSGVGFETWTLLFFMAYFINFKQARLFNRDLKVIEMFVKCIVYETWISSLCCFGVNQPFCYVVFEHLHNLEERASCLAVFYFRVESLGFSKPESLMYEFLVPSRDSFTFSVIMIDHSNAMPMTCIPN